MADTLLTGTTLVETTTRGTGSIPIGGMVKVWTITETPTLPVGWQRCNGTNVADVESPFHGKTTPNIPDEGNLKWAVRIK